MPTILSPPPLPLPAVYSRRAAPRAELTRRPPLPFIFTHMSSASHRRCPPVAGIPRGAPLLPRGPPAQPKPRFPFQGTPCPWTIARGAEAAPPSFARRGGEVLRMRGTRRGGARRRRGTRRGGSIGRERRRGGEQRSRRGRCFVVLSLYRRSCRSRLDRVPQPRAPAIPGGEGEKAQIPEGEAGSPLFSSVRLRVPELPALDRPPAPHATAIPGRAAQIPGESFKIPVGEEGKQVHIHTCNTAPAAANRYKAGQTF
jgi:hypothetical protein